MLRPYYSLFHSVFLFVAGAVIIYQNHIQYYDISAMSCHLRSLRASEYYCSLFISLCLYNIVALFYLWKAKSHSALYNIIGFKSNRTKILTAFSILNCAKFCEKTELRRRAYIFIFTLEVLALHTRRK